MLNSLISYTNFVKIRFAVNNFFFVKAMLKLTIFVNIDTIIGIIFTIFV